MRIRTTLLIVSALLVVGGCPRAETPVAAGGTSSADTPVGPVPGGVQLAHYPTNPLANDPVALQDGRRLFNWYNCSGCHGGHAGGGMVGSSNVQDSPTRAASRAYCRTW